MSNVKVLQEMNQISSGKYNIIDYARNYLWRDMASWSRAYITGIHSEPSYKEAVFQKLYSIPTNFRSIFAIIFGDQASETYTNQLSQHIIILTELISAMTNGDQKAVNENTVKLYQNADSRAAFLSQINPYWSESVWRSFLYYYIQLTIQEITAFLSGDHDTSIKIYDRLLFHAVQMSDYFSDGLIKYIIESGGNM